MKTNRQLGAGGFTGPNTVLGGIPNYGGETGEKTPAKQEPAPGLKREPQKRKEPQEKSVRDPRKRPASR